jgi:DNA processing protein
MTVRLGIRLDARQKRDWLRLSRCEGVGPRAFKTLINRHGGAGAALAALPQLARERGREVFMPSEAEIETEMRAAERFGVTLLASGEEGYPESLLTIDGPPPILAVKGQLALLEKVGVGIVGARNASASGRRMAGLLARDLGEAGFSVVSGLARGVDAEAHRTALESGTIAVLAGGLDKPYPPENAALADEIAEKGVIVSEMPLGLSPRGRDFPRRNRLIAGLSSGVVIVEAARRSGSLITARMAAEQGRQVFAVPGSPLDPRCEGSNDLLRDGASIACSAEDIIAALRPMAGEVGRPLALFREEAPFDDVFEEESEDLAGDQPVAQRVFGLLSLNPVEIDTLVRMSGVSTSAMQGALMELELEGLIRREAGNRVSRLP